MNAARKAKKAMLTAANDGIETFGPRKGENMTYWRAVSILTALCTIITAGETNMNAAFDQAARDEHVRKTTVKEIWGRFTKARAEGNTSDALDYYWDVPDGRTGNAKAQV